MLQYHDTRSSEKVLAMIYSTLPFTEKLYFFHEAIDFNAGNDFEDFKSLHLKGKWNKRSN